MRDPQATTPTEWESGQQKCWWVWYNSMKQCIYTVHINSPTCKTDRLGLAQTGFFAKFSPLQAVIYCMKLLLAVNWKCCGFQSACIFIFNEALIRAKPSPEPCSCTLCSLCISMTVSSGFLHLLVQTCNFRSLSSAHAHSMTVVCGFLQQNFFAITSSTLLTYCSHIAKTLDMQNVPKDQRF